nr:splicing factor 3B subunit 1-like [Cherax quadricarinatus]
MAAVRKFTTEDVEAQIQDIQNRKASLAKGGPPPPPPPAQDGLGKDEERVRLDGGGYFDSDIYDISNGNKYANYVQSIGVDDLDEEDDDGGTTLGKKGTNTYTAPQLFLNEMGGPDPMVSTSGAIADRGGRVPCSPHMRSYPPGWIVCRGKSMQYVLCVSTIDLVIIGTWKVITINPKE